MTDLSETGMAVHTVKPLNYSAVVDFAFELPLRTIVKGKEQVMWTNTQGMAGIALQIFRDGAKENLAAWLGAGAAW